MSTEIRLATTTAELEAIYRFRFAIYVEEMRRPQKDADHERKRIVDGLDPGSFVLGAWENGEVVGTVRLNLLRLSDIGDYFGMYAMNRLSPELLTQTSITTRLMIHPRFRGGSLGMRLSCALFSFAIERGVEVDVIDCNAHLVAFFTGLGYRFHGDDFTHPEYGAVTVMRLDLHDYLHLESIRSPFRRLLANWQAKSLSTQPITLNA